MSVEGLIDRAEGKPASLRKRREALFDALFYLSSKHGDDEASQMVLSWATHVLSFPFENSVNLESALSTDLIEVLAIIRTSLGCSCLEYTSSLMSLAVTIEAEFDRRFGSERGNRFVYLIGSNWDEPLKIGVSDDPYKRARQLSTGSPKALVVLGLFLGDEGVERVLHQALGPLRLNGEWFRNDGGIVRDVFDRAERAWRYERETIESEARAWLSAGPVNSAEIQLIALEKLKLLSGARQTANREERIESRLEVWPEIEL